MRRSRIKASCLQLFSKSSQFSLSYERKSSSSKITKVKKSLATFNVYVKQQQQQQQPILVNRMSTSDESKITKDVKQAARDVKEGASQMAEKLTPDSLKGQSAENLEQQAREQARDTKHEAEEKSKGLMGSVRSGVESVEHFGESIYNKLTGQKEKLADTAESAKADTEKYAKSKTEQAKEKGEEMKQQMQEKGHEAKERGEGLFAAAKEKVSHLGEKIAHPFGGSSSDKPVTEQAKDVTKGTETPSG